MNKNPFGPWDKVAIVTGGGTGIGAAKAAVINFTKALAVEFTRHNIRVNGIGAGMIITEAAREQMGMTPESQARRVQGLSGQKTCAPTT